MHKQSVLLILLLLLLCCCTAGFSAAEQEKDITVMIYMCGCDLESSGGAANADILEMIRSGMDASRVNTVLLTGGATRWKTGFPADQTGLYRIDPAAPGYFTQEALYPLMNMGDPETLQFFLDTCYENYPAENYILILWDHGGGPLVGVCVDRLFDNDMLTLSELEQALSRSLRGKLQIIGFDACLMGSLETAAVCAPYADYMIASQELEPGKGWNYTFLSGIENDANGVETASRILETYFAASESKIKKGVPVTMSCVDLRRMDDLIAALNPVFRSLAQSLTPDSFSAYSVSREATASVARSAGVEYDLVDLGSLLRHSENLADTAAALQALEQTLILQRSTREELTGLTIYYPFYNKEKYVTEWGSAYPAISSAADYADLVRSFGDILTGDTLTDWRIPAPIQTADGGLTVTLTSHQLEHYVSAELVILNYITDGDGYFFSNRHSDVTLDTDGSLFAKAENLSLYAVDASGNPLTSPLTFWQRDEFYVVRAMLYHDVPELSALPEIKYCEAAEIRLRPSGDSRRLEIVDAIILDSDTGMAGPSGLDLSDWDSCEFSIWAYSLPDESEGPLPPYDQWSRSDMIYNSASLSLADLDGFSFLKGDLFNQPQYAYFEILDVQGDRHASQLISLPNDNVSILNDNRILLDHSDISARLDQLRIALSGINPGIGVSFSAANHSAENVELTVRSITVNGIGLDGGWIQGGINAGESRQCGFLIGAESLQKAGIRHVKRIAFQLQVKQDFVETGRYTVSFDTDIDLSTLIDPMDRHLIGRGESEGLTVDVYNYSVGNNGQLLLDIGLFNHSGHSFRLDSSDLHNRIAVLVNGCTMNAEGLFETALYYGVHDGYPLLPDLADGECWYGIFQILPVPGYVSTFSSLLLDPLDQDDCFLAYGIRSIESIEIDRFDFSLRLDFPEPLDYAGVRSPSKAYDPDYPILLDTKDALIRLESIRWIDHAPTSPDEIRSVNDEIGIVLQLTNRSDLPVTVGWISRYLDAAINRIPVPFTNNLSSFSDIVILPGTTSRYMVTMRLPDDWSDSPVTSLEFPLVYQLDREGIIGPTIHLDLNTPLLGAGNSSHDFFVSIK